MHDEEAVRRILAEYCQFCDDGRFDELATLFATDAGFTVMGRTHQGAEAIRAFMQAAQPPEARGKHVISEPVIELDGDTADCRTDFAFVARRGDSFAITSAGRYVDRLAHDGDRWRFASRRIVFLGEP